MVREAGLEPARYYNFATVPQTVVAAITPFPHMVPRLGFEPRSHRLRVWYNNHYTNKAYTC